MKTIERILEWVDSKSIPYSQFESTAKLSNGYLKNMKKSNSEISPKKLKDVLTAYPDLESYLESHGHDIGKGKSEKGITGSLGEIEAKARDFLSIMFGRQNIGKITSAHTKAANEFQQSLEKLKEITKDLDNKEQER